MSSPQVAVGIVDRYFDAIRCGDQEAWVGCFARDGVFVTGDGDAVRGHDALRELFPLLWTAFGGLDVERAASIETTGATAVHWRRGLDGRPASGIDVFEIDETGRLRAVWGSWATRSS